MIVTFDVDGGISRAVEMDAAAVPEAGEVVVVRTPQGITRTRLRHRWLVLAVDESGKVAANIGMHLESIDQ